MIPGFDAERFRAMHERVRSPQMRAFYERRVQQAEMSAQARQQASGHPQWTLPPEGAFAGPVPIGVLYSGELLGIEPRQLLGPTVILGKPGVGKTVMLHRLMLLLAQLGVVVIGFDTKERHDHAWPHPLPVLEPGDAAMSLDAPHGMPQEMFERRVLTLIEQSLWLSSGSVVIAETIARLRQVLPEGYAPCLHGVLDFLLRERLLKRSSGKIAQHRDSAIVALERLCRGHALFSGVNTLPWEARFAHSHVLRLRDLPSEAIRIGVLSYLEAYLGSAPSGPRELRTLFAVDDARVVAKQVKREGQVAVDALTRFIDQAETSGGSVLLNIQHCGEIAPELLNTAETVIVIGPVAGSDLGVLRHRFDLDKERAQFLRVQPAFHAVLHSRGGPWPYPVPMRLLPLPEVEQSALDRAREGLKARMLDGVGVELWSPEMLEARREPAAARQEPRRSKAGEQTLDPKLHRLLCVVLDKPHLIQDEIGKAGGVRGRELTACRDELSQLGCIRSHRIAGLVLWEVTLQGAEAVGRSFGPLKGRGSFVHRWCQARWAAGLKGIHDRVEIEFAISGLGVVDGYAERSGERVALEVVLDLNKTLERAVEKLRGFGGERVLIVADQKAIASVKKAVLDLDQIALVTVRELVRREA